MDRPIPAQRSGQTLQIAKNVAQWYASGYDQLLNPALKDLFNDAYFDRKMVVVPVILSMQEILNNEGQAQLMDVYVTATSRRPSARSRTPWMRRSTPDGTANGGKQITGLATAIPIVNNVWHLRRHRSIHCGDLADQTIYDATSFPMAVALGIYASVLDLNPPDAQLHHDQTEPRQRITPDHADHVAGALRGLRRRNCRDTRGKPIETIARQTGVSRLWNISAAASAPRSCSTAASARTCRPIRRSA